MDATDQSQESALERVRSSFTGKMLTESQLRESMAIAEIIQSKIQKTGSFTDALSDHAHLFARSERFDALRGESIVRDVFQARYGQTMNQMREGLISQEENWPDDATIMATECARSIDDLIKEGETMPFYKAYDHAAHKMATALGITEMGAKKMINSAFQEAEGKDLYEHGKALETVHHEPVREAARAARTNKRQTAKRQQTKARHRC